MVVQVSTTSDLQQAIYDAIGPTTIMLVDGTYPVLPLDRILVTQDDITIRSLSGNRDAVVIQGAGMAGSGEGYGFYIDASRVTIADLTVRDVVNHALFVSPFNEPEDTLFYNVRCIDAGQQVVKASGTDLPKRRGRIACSEIGYTTTLDEGNYTNGIDLLNSHDWIIESNIIRNIRAAPGAGLAGPAILIWHDSTNTIIRNNQIIDCDMGIFFGNSSESGIIHTGGSIVNNMVKGHADSDAAIGIVRSQDAYVGHNSLFYGSATPWSIEVRYAESSGNLIENNLMDKNIQFRDGGTATLQGNLQYGDPAWLFDPGSGDFHLLDGTPPIDAGVPTLLRTEDFDCEVVTGTPDVGADEFLGFQGTKGDINDDGAIDIRDGSACVSIKDGSITPSPQAFWAADMNDDQSVDGSDVLLLLPLML